MDAELQKTQYIDWRAKENDWRDHFRTLPEFYKEVYESQKYHILDYQEAKNGNMVINPKFEKEAFPYYTFDNYELEIDPNETDEDLETYSFERQLQEVRKCMDSFPYFCHKYVRISHPLRGLVPFILYNYQRRVISEYAHYRWCIISKFRQGGLTTVTSIWGLWRCMFKRDQILMLMSKTDREAINAGEMVSRAVDWFPAWLRESFCKFKKNNDHVKVFEATGSRFDFQGPEAARSRALTYFILDEAAHIDNMEKHWKAMYPTLSTGGNCIAVSTVNGLGNWYEQMYHGAEAGKNKFHIIDLDFWEHPDYNDAKWVSDSKAQLTQKGWDQEVMRSFLGSGDTYISGDIITELDLKTRDSYPMRFIYPEWNNEVTDTEPLFYPEKGALWIFKEPQDGRTYTLAVDSADGVGVDGDNSCFQIMDDISLEQVGEFYSNTVPPHIFAQIINEVAIYYNNATVVVENMCPASGGVMSALQHTLMYDNLWYDPTNRSRTVQPGIKCNQQLRPSILERLQQRLQERAVAINSPRFVHELKTFIWNSSRKRAEAQVGKHDDAIMAMAITLYVRDNAMRDIPVGAVVPDSVKSVFNTEVYKDIKRQLMDGAPEDWFTDDEPEDFFAGDSEDVLPGVVFNVKRKYDKLLREFGW